MKRALLVAVMLGSAAVESAQQVPSFQVDPFWPQPLPNHWLLGSVTGVAVDANDHVWVVHRGYDSMTARTEIGAATTPKTADECCVPAPPVLEFDPGGKLVGHWGGPGDKYDWPVSPGGITIDPKGAVWIAAAGPPEIPGAGNVPTPTRSRTTTTPSSTSSTSSPLPRPQDAHVLKFSRAGDFQLQIGKAGSPVGDDSTTGLNKPANVEIDPASDELYVADGFGNHRVVVFDATSGAYRRHWGSATQFKTVSCVRVARDGKVYVCDRGNNRIQVFDKTGKYLAQAAISETTKATGSVWDIALSRDPQQRFLYVADGHDQQVFIVRRDTLEIVGSFGDGGRIPGRFYSVGSVAVDSKGNVYTGETLEGKRVQKFIRR